MYFVGVFFNVGKTGFNAFIGYWWLAFLFSKYIIPWLCWFAFNKDQWNSYWDSVILSKSCQNTFNVGHHIICSNIAHKQENFPMIYIGSDFVT